MDSDGIAVSGLLGKNIPWSALTGVDLRYFSTKRDKSDGWMELRLTGPDGKICLESSLTEFDTVVRQVAVAARDNAIDLSQSCLTNMAAMGIRDAMPDRAGYPNTGREAAPDP
jgi:hypothetical protein